MTIHPTIRGSAIAVLGIVGCAAFAVAHYNAEIARLTFALTGAQDEALGPSWSKVRTSRDIAAAVPGLVDEIATARKAGTKPVAAVNVKSGATTFDGPPCNPASPDAAHAGPVEAGGAPEAVPPLLVTGEAQGAVTGLADGTVRQTWRMWATLTRGDWTERRELADVHGDIAIDPALAAAWKAATGPPSYRLDAFVGASLGLDGVGIVGQVSGGRGRVGWFAQIDYTMADPALSRVAGGAKFTVKK